MLHHPPEPSTHIPTGFRTFPARLTSLLMPAPESSSVPLARGWLKALGPTAVLGALWTASPAILGTVLLVYLGPVSEWLRSLGAWGLAVYAAVFIVSAGVGFLPTYGQSFLGGWTFGFATGFPGDMVGFVGGSVLGHAPGTGLDAAAQMT